MLITKYRYFIFASAFYHLGDRKKVFSVESSLVTSARRQEALCRASEHRQASLLSLEQGLLLDFVSIYLRAVYDTLEVTGETASEDLLERIFSEFCIGK